MSQLSMRTARKGRPTRAASLRGAVSVLAFAVAGLGVAAAGSAQAQSACTGAAVTITSTSSPLTPISLDPSGVSGGGGGSTCPSSVTVASGATAAVVMGNSYLGTVQNKGWVPLVDNTNISGYNNALTTYPTGGDGGGIFGGINVQAGGKLVFAALQSDYGEPFLAIYSGLNAQGDVEFESTGGYENSNNKFAFTGTNTMAGNVTLDAGARVLVGEYYSPNTSATFGNYTASWYDASTINFGANTNVSLLGSSTAVGGHPADTLLGLDLSAPAVIGGYLSATAYSEVWLHAGTLTVNGANTTANPFAGYLQLDAGSTFIVGDSSHPGAVFGDPNHTDGSSLTLNISRVSGTPVTLEGYGTIYGKVNNSGVVTVGGTAGKIGTLTISQYTQTSTGMLNIEVTPKGASELKVLGNASLAGTLALTIDPGNYGNSIMPIVTTGGTLTVDKNLSITTKGSLAAGLAITSNSIDVVTELNSSLQAFGHLVAADRAHVNAFNDSLYDAQSDSLRGFGAEATSEYGKGTSAWVQPFGQTSSISHAGYGYDANSAGVTGGIEHRWSAFNALVGVAGSYSEGNLKTDAGQTSATTHTWDGAVYGGFDMPNARIEGVAFYNGYDADVARRLGSAGTINSSPKATTYGVSLQVSHGIANNVFVPYIRVTYANIDQDALTENGSNLLALKVNQLEEGYFTGEAGLKIHPDQAIKLPWGLHSEITLAAQHDFSQTPGETVVGSFANLKSAPFTFAWAGDQGTSGVAGLNLASDVTSHIQVFGKLDGRFSTYGRTGELRFGASYRF